MLQFITVAILQSQDGNENNLIVEDQHNMRNYIKGLQHWEG